MIPNLESFGTKNSDVAFAKLVEQYYFTIIDEHIVKCKYQKITFRSMYFQVNFGSSTSLAVLTDVLNLMK